MKKATNNEKRLHEYLLGQMDPEEQARLEEQYLADPDLHEELRAAERDLIDEYVRGELPNPVQFEKYFLTSPSRRQRVEFARALTQSLAQAPVASEKSERSSGWASFVHFFQGHPRWLPAAAAAALVILVAGSLMIMNRRQQNPANPVAEVQQPADGSSPQPPAPLPQPAEPPRPQPAPPVRAATFILTPTLIRSVDETQPLNIEGNVEVNLELHFEGDDYGSYQVMLRTPEGEEISKWDRLKPQRAASGKAVIVNLPSSRFSDGDYTIRLSGVTAAGEVEEVGSYYFRVKKE